MALSKEMSVVIRDQFRPAITTALYKRAIESMVHDPKKILVGSDSTESNSTIDIIIQEWNHHIRVQINDELEAVDVICRSVHGPAGDRGEHTSFTAAVDDTESVVQFIEGWIFDNSNVDILAHVLKQQAIFDQNAKLSQEQAEKIRDQLRENFTKLIENQTNQPPGKILVDSTQTVEGPVCEIVIPEWTEHVWMIVNRELGEIVVFCIHDGTANVLQEFVGGFAPSMNYINSKSDTEGFGVYRGSIDNPDTAIQFVLDWIHNNSPA